MATAGAKDKAPGPSTGESARDSTRRRTTAAMGWPVDHVSSAVILGTACPSRPGVDRPLLVDEKRDGGRTRPARKMRLVLTPSDSRDGPVTIWADKGVQFDTAEGVP
jgi:hypothetical protein